MYSMSLFEVHYTSPQLINPHFSDMCIIKRNLVVLWITKLSGYCITT